MALIRNLRKGSTELELQDFFAALLGVVMTWAAPIQAAFSKARKLLSQQRLIDLNGQAIKTFCAVRSTPRCEGFWLRAVDGTTLRLPPGETLARAFGAQASRPTPAGGSVLDVIGHDLARDARVAVM